MRWLTYLHSQALAAKQRQDLPITHQLQQATLADLNLSSQPSSTSIRPVPTAAGAVDTTAPSSEAGLASTQNGKAAPSAAAAQANATPAPCSGGSHHLDPVSQSETNGKVSRSASSNDGDVALLDWQTDAQQYATVEKWFHALVRAHFKGSLKVSVKMCIMQALDWLPCLLRNISNVMPHTMTLCVEYQVLVC